jgi:hypothetical protein
MIILKEGNRIHLKNKVGLYTVVLALNDCLYISCRSWQARANHPELIVHKKIKYTDVKCVAGGINNRNINRIHIPLIT